MVDGIDRKRGIDRRLSPEGNFLKAIIRGYRRRAITLLTGAKSSGRGEKRAHIRSSIKDLKAVLDLSPQFRFWCELAGLDPKTVRLLTRKAVMEETGLTLTEAIRELERMLEEA